MTIKTRNRLTLTLFFVALVFMFLYTGFFCYQFFTDNLQIPEVYLKGIPKNFLLTYNPICVFSALFINCIFICASTLFIYRSFEKTQATEITFFLLFLLACFLDTSRFIIPLCKLSGSFSKFFIEVGNIHIFARILAPLSLFGNAVLSSQEFRLNSDRNVIIILVTSLFFAYFIPLNTSVILPNFSVSYGYVRLLRFFSFVICIINFITLFMTNMKSEYSQKSTVGYVFLSFGYSIMFSCYNIAGLISGPILFVVGTIIYLRETHNHYLWVD